MKKTVNEICLFVKLKYLCTRFPSEIDADVYQGSLSLGFFEKFTENILLVNFLCLPLQSERLKDADVAQLAEHLICNQAAVGSSPSIGSIPGVSNKSGRN